MILTDNSKGPLKSISRRPKLEVRVTRRTRKRSRYSSRCGASSDFRISADWEVTHSGISLSIPLLRSWQSKNRLQPSTLRLIAVWKRKEEIWIYEWIITSTWCSRMSGVNCIEKWLQLYWGLVGTEYFFCGLSCENN